ncbi:MAG: TPM domain-containing protein [Candidatus Rokubacteria bacterium]|nr:TPM domain-containing protein [Candidatus Rokubacteria bacterium]
MAKRPAWTRQFLSEADFDAIAQAIEEAESRTSAEIRVHLERRVPRRLFRRTPDPLTRARHVFARLGMHTTAARNGVLIYLAVSDRKLAVVGDEGIHARVGDQHWDGVRDRMIEKLRAGAARDALLGAIGEVGRELAVHYPPRRGDVNELGDEVSVS